MHSISMSDKSAHVGVRLCTLVLYLTTVPIPPTRFMIGLPLFLASAERVSDLARSLSYTALFDKKASL